MNYAQYLRRASLMVFTAMVLPALFVIYADPFQIFHKVYNGNIGLTANQRFQNAGLINSYLADPAEGYDSILVGTSLSENFTTQAAINNLHWRKPLRLFMNGGSPQEIALTLSHALHIRQVKHVLWEISPSMYSPEIRMYPLNEQQYPTYLYNENNFDDLRYIFNIDTLKFSYWVVKGYQNQFPFTADTLGIWADRIEVQLQHDNFNSQKSLNALHTETVTTIASFAAHLNPQHIAQSYIGIDESVLPILKTWCNQDIDFELFIPPASKLEYLGKPEYGYRSAMMPAYILKNIHLCKNIRLHAFDDLSFTNDLNNYKDVVHFGLHISNYILEQIGKGQNGITLQNVKAYEDAFIQSVDNYKVYSSYPSEPSI